MCTKSKFLNGYQGTRDYFLYTKKSCWDSSHFKITIPFVLYLQIGKVNIVILKQGPLNKTKLLENGKKHRKNWTNSHVVLTDTFLLFFKDAKTFASMQSGGHTKPGKGSAASRSFHVWGGLGWLDCMEGWRASWAVHGCFWSCMVLLHGCFVVHVCEEARSNSLARLAG